MSDFRRENAECAKLCRERSKLAAELADAAQTLKSREELLLLATEWLSLAVEMEKVYGAAPISQSRAQPSRNGS